MNKLFKKFGFGGEKAVVLTADERLELISNKAQDTYTFGDDKGEAQFVVGTDGYDVEEITPEELRIQLGASKVASMISRIEDPTMELEDPTFKAAKNNDSWGQINPKGRLSGGC